MVVRPLDHRRCTCPGDLRSYYGTGHVPLRTFCQGFAVSLVQLLLDWLDHSACVPIGILGNGCLVGLSQAMVLGTVRVFGFT